MVMNLTHLAAFAAVAEAGSFVGGARRLMVGQPALSSHVSNLERAMKVTLFERLPRGVRLTEAGTLLLGYARRIWALESQAEQAINELRGLSRGRLRIGASTTVGAYLMPKLIGIFSARHPGVEVILDIGNAAQIEARLVHGELDLAVTEGYVENPTLSAEPVFHDRLVVIAAPSHPWAKRGKVDSASLNSTPLIMREPGSGTRDVVERALAAKGIRPRIAMSIGSTEAIKQAVMAGLGLAIVSRMTVEHELNSGALCEVMLTDLTIQRPILLALILERPLGLAAAAFLPLLKNAHPPAASTKPAVHPR